MSAPPPSKPAPELASGNSDLGNDLSNTDRLVKLITLGGGGPATRYPTGSIQRKVMDVTLFSMTRNIYGGYQTVRCYNSCA
jgi:hypothetical protein